MAIHKLTMVKRPGKPSEGDTVFEYDIDIAEQVQEAQTQFEQMIQLGHFAACVNAEGQKELLPSFNQDVDEILIFAPIAGG